MTIMKAIALTALTGTLLAAPQAAFAKSAGAGGGTHGQSGAASAATHANAGTRSGHALGGAAASLRDKLQAGEQDDQDGQADQDSEDEASGDDGAGGSKADRRAKLGAIISGLHHGGRLTDLSRLSTDFTVQQVDLSKYDNIRALDNALGRIDQTALQANLSSDTDVAAALQAANIDISTVAFAYVNADGNLVVFTR